MQIYVNKNNQQLGPFDDNTVVEMLKNGQLSAGDLAIKQGEQQWQPLGNLFPMTSVASAVPNQILPDSIPAKKGFGCLRLFGIALVFLAVVTLIGGLANYRMRNFNDFSCQQAETEKRKVDEAFAKLPPAAKNASSKNSLIGEDRVKLEDYDSKMKGFTAWAEACSYVRTTKSFWINVTIGVSVVSLLIGIVGLAMIFIPRRK